MGLCAPSASTPAPTDRIPVSTTTITATTTTTQHSKTTSAIIHNHQQQPPPPSTIKQHQRLSTTINNNHHHPAPLPSSNVLHAESFTFAFQDVPVRDQLEPIQH